MLLAENPMTGHQMLDVAIEAPLAGDILILEMSYV